MKDGIEFILETIQGGRKKPKKYRHYVRIPVSLYEELVCNGIIQPDYLWSEEIAYFEYSCFVITISFITYAHVEDTHIRILDYLVRKSNDGISPVERGGHSF